MNDARRKELSRARSLIEEAQGIIQGVREEEQEASDNLAENFQSSEKGQAMEEKINELQEADDACDTISGNLETASE